MVTLVSWAVVAGLIAAFISLPLASLLSLILLIAGFEAVHQLHVGVERAGRYLYARYESGIGGTGLDGTGAGTGGRLMWEGAISAFGAGHRPSTRPADALFTLPFIFAIVINFLVSTLGSRPEELIGIGVVHLLVIVRILFAKRAAARQRAEDQKRFEELLK